MGGVVVEFTMTEEWGGGVDHVCTMSWQKFLPDLALAQFYT